MWRNQLLSSLTCFLLIRCQASSDCQLPTEDDPISICSYCSDSHAGVRWQVHESTVDNYPYGAFNINIKFHCNNSESDDNMRDDCFNGDLFPGLRFIINPVWRWHILEHRLPDGTECHFTVDVDDGFYQDLNELSSSCTVHSNDSNENLILPATCSEPSEEECSCQCGEGFKIDDEVNHSKLLTCLNVDECSEGTHKCTNVSNCVDTEGSYYCEDDETTTTTVAPVNGPPETSQIHNTTTLVISNETSTLPPTTARGTTVTLYTTIDTLPGTVSVTFTAAASVVITTLSLLSMVIAVIITISILRKKRCLNKDKQIMTVSPPIADHFDPDFCPVDIEKFDSSSLSTFSIKTVLDPLQFSTNVDVLSTSNSFGSVIILDFCD